MDTKRRLHTHYVPSYIFEDENFLDYLIPN